MKQLVLKVHPKDNVLVALTPLAKGAVVSYNGEEYKLAEDIPAKHKFFTREMQAGEELIVYGVLVGKAQSAVPRGGRMTTTNSKHAPGDYAWRNAAYEWHQPDISKFKG